MNEIVFGMFILILRNYLWKERKSKETTIDMRAYFGGMIHIWPHWKKCFAEIQIDAWRYFGIESEMDSWNDQIHSPHSKHENKYSNISSEDHIHYINTFIKHHPTENKLNRTKKRHLTSIIKYSFNNLKKITENGDKKTITTLN